jgi:hypothetical protein
MPPLKCFNCGKIGHFANKYLYAKRSDSDEEEYHKKEKKYQKGNKKYKIKVFKKNIYQREDNSSSNEDDETNSDSNKVLVVKIQMIKKEKECEKSRKGNHDIKS